MRAASSILLTVVICAGCCSTGRPPWQRIGCMDACDDHCCPVPVACSASEGLTPAAPKQLAPVPPNDLPAPPGDYSPAAAPKAAPPAAPAFEKPN